MEAIQSNKQVVESTRNPLTLLIRWFSHFFGDKAVEVERFIKFAIVGVIGAVVDFGVLNVLEYTVLVPEGPDNVVQFRVALATGIAFTTAVVHNFIVNRYWTYPDSRSRSLLRQLWQFFVVSIVGLVFRLVFVGATFQFFGELGLPILQNLSLVDAMDSTAVNQLGSNIAQAISIFIVLFWNYFANRLWTFNDVS